VRRTVFLDIVGLTPALLREMPALSDFARTAGTRPLLPSLPAVTSTVQAGFLTGATPGRHGVVGNGWYSRDDGEVRFWRRSSANIQAPLIWDVAKQRDQRFTCANLFFMHAMFSRCDWTVAARPSYPADGRKIPDCYGKPDSLRHELQRELGPFPLFRFWGPGAGIASTRWIVDAAMHVDRRFAPTLMLVYLPHLDYPLQRFGRNAPRILDELLALDREVGRLVRHFEQQGVQVVIGSEYGIDDVQHPVHLNRVLREAGLLTVREELGRELLEPGDSTAFAVADHQLAHVYVNDRSRLADVKRLVEQTEGVDRVYDESTRAEIALDHPRSGELIALASTDAWFTYYYWLDDAKMPDFARTVDIHRKPGYDPCELFLDPNMPLMMLRLASKMLRRKLGFRTLLDVIPTDATLVRGSHGRLPASAEHGPLLLTGARHHLPGEPIPAERVFGVLLDHVFAD
jgi:predicted AlkP superfamily pyrophosphatase or phosphodiesterase